MKKLILIILLLFAFTANAEVMYGVRIAGTGPSAGGSSPPSDQTQKWYYSYAPNIVGSNENSWVSNNTYALTVPVTIGTETSVRALAFRTINNGTATLCKLGLYNTATPSVRLASATCIPADNDWCIAELSTPYTASASTTYRVSHMCDAAVSTLMNDDYTNGFLNETSYAAFPAASYTFGSYASHWDSAVCTGNNACTSPSGKAFAHFETTDVDTTTITATVLANSTACGDGYWYTSDTPGLLSISTSGDLPMYSSKATCEKTYSGAGTRGMKYTHTTGNASIAYGYYWRTGVAQASLSFMWNSGNIADDGPTYAYSLAGINGSGGTTYVHIQAHDGELEIEATGGPVTGDGALAISNATSYWITIQYIQNGAAKVRIYNPTTGALLNSQDATLGNVAAVSASLGKTGAELGVAGAYYYFDNIIIDYKTGALVTP